MIKNPLVSILMITYNHEAFISQAIEGVLMQKTHFPIELVIGEDFSTDKTREICLEYQKQYPNIVRLLDRLGNLGMQKNFAETLSECKGKYIALCEGDDYWTDSLKLQKQVDFLEENPEFVVCHHNLKISSDLNESHEKFVSHPNCKEIAEFEDLAESHFVHTASCIYRNGLFNELPEWFYSTLCTDHVLYLIIAQHGKIKYLDETMGVYRIHKGGVWSGKKVEEQIDEFIKTIKKCRQYFAPRGTKQFINHEILLTADLCFFRFEEKKYKEFRNRYYQLLSDYKTKIPLRIYVALTVRYILSFAPISIFEFYKQMGTSIKNIHRNS